MPRLHPMRAAEPRKGVILMVVIILLTLFAVVGLSFLLYAGSEATSSRIYRESFTVSDTRPDIPPNVLFSYGLGQIIFDADDATNPWSGMRGWSLARDMYGWNSDNPGSNIYPFNGMGRWHTGTDQSTKSPNYINPFNQDDFFLINYTANLGGDTFIRDPERYGNRQTPSQTPLPPYTGGWNSSYTYPDLNHVFLGAVKADTTVLTPSFHRHWLFNPKNALNDMTNPSTNPNANLNWWNPVGKYLTLRPRPIDQLEQGETLFQDTDGLWKAKNQQGVVRIVLQPPVSPGGDVQNLTGGQGYYDPITQKYYKEDSIWVDLGYPTTTGPDGTKFKPLFAILITDLDGRLNINAAGNIRGQNNLSVSNQGLGRWEMNPTKLVNPNDPQAAAKVAEWANLFTGINPQNGKPVIGRYGPDGTPDGQPLPLWASGPSSYTPPSYLGFPGLFNHLYAQTDFDACNDGPGGQLTAQIQVPGNGTPNAYMGIPLFPAGYYNGCDNGSSPRERTNHPALFDIFRPGLSDDKVFDPSNTMTLLFSSNSATSYKNCDLGQLLPLNLGDPAYGPRIRNLITTHSFDVDQPGVTPWLYNRDTSQYVTTGAPYGSGSAPAGPAVPSPALSQRSGTLPTNTEFAPDWRWALPDGALNRVLSRVDLNRFLPPYPHMGRSNGTNDPKQYSPQPLVTALNLRFDQDAPNGPIFTQFLAAQTARQQLADDIYRLLLRVTGVAAPSNVAAPTATDLMPRRWLAQLAVNIVDFIDEDDISTPFNFYGPEDGFQGNLNDVSVPNSPETLKYWVFGTELPRVVLNEALAELTQTPPPVPPPPPGSATYTLNFYAELLNPTVSPAANGLPANQSGSVQPLDAQPVQLFMPSSGASGSTPYSPYQVAVNGFAAANQPLLSTTTGGTAWNNNVLGTPDTQTIDPNCIFLCGTSNGTDSHDFTNPTPALGQTNVVPNKGKPVGSAVATAIYPQGTPGSPPPSSYFMVGSANPDANNAIDSGNNVPTPMPANTPYMQSGPATGQGAANNLTWPPVGGPPLTTKPAVVNFFLRRLVNPYLPPTFQAPNDPAPPNLYFTVDIVQNVTPQPTQSQTQAGQGAQEQSAGKQQPYASDPGSGQIQPQNINTATNINGPPPGKSNGGTTQNSFGIQNVKPAQGYYDWLFQADRQVTSPMELLQVSGFRPYELTQMFITSAGKYKHLVPWFDQDLAGSGQSHRLSRIFEFLTCHDRLTGVSFGGRLPGKLNLNTLWDQEPFFALCDPAPQGQQPPFPNFFTYQDVQTVWSNLLAQRTPGLANPQPGQPFIGPGDAPFVSTSIGSIPSPGNAYCDPLAGTSGTLSINNTFLCPTPAGGPANAPRLFQAPSVMAANPPAHPYQQNELLNKIFNNITTRSNVFAVWITVGFFQVYDDTVRPAKLGPEIGATTNTNIRHRMFAIVDRTNLVIKPALTGLTTAVSQPGPQAVTLQALSGPAQTALGLPFTWNIVQGTTLLVDTGVNQETVIVQAVNPQNNQILANFMRPHTPQGNAPIPVTIPGNPGPQPLFDPHDPNYAPVVPYSAVLQ